MIRFNSNSCNPKTPQSRRLAPSVLALMLALCVSGGAGFAVAQSGSKASPTTTAGESQGQDQGAPIDSMKRTFAEGWLEGKIETAILLNPYLNPFDINTTVHQKDVYLSGTVNSDIDRELAENLVEGIKGVEQVHNNIEVKPSVTHSNPNAEKSGFIQAVSDATTTATVKTKLLASKNVDGMDINVTTKGGVVTLKGKVSGQEMKELAGKIAQNVDSVVHVNNQLTVTDKSNS